MKLTSSNYIVQFNMKDGQIFGYNHSDYFITLSQEKYFIKKRDDSEVGYIDWHENIIDKKELDSIKIIEPEQSLFDTLTNAFKP